MEVMHKAILQRLKEGRSITLAEAFELLEEELNEEEKVVLENFKKSLKQLKEGKLVEAVGEDGGER
jgi:Cu/Ag efflux protein CusF